MVLSSVLGFPRIGTTLSPNFGLLLTFTTLSFLGANREVKKAVEAYWAGKISADELTKATAEVKKTSWTSVKAHGVDFVPRYTRIRIDLSRDIGH
jgi:hypothetical protein